jgi:hypothetical protein
MSPDPRQSATPTEAASATQSLVEAMLAAAPAAPSPGPPSLVGECVDNKHPSLTGRYLIAYALPDGTMVRRWLPGLHMLAVRPRDRVLLVNPGNWPEPLVVGVIDGFAHRPEAEASVGAQLTLQPDEVLRVNGTNGEKLIEIRQEEEGPVVRLLTPDVHVDLPGKLRLTAKSIEMNASLGDVKIKAAHEVIVKGEAVHLN